MADNKTAPSSLSPNSLENNLVRVEGGNMVSHITTTNNNNVTLIPQKKPRGRPPGSKNKPKPPVNIDQDNNMKMIYIEIPSGKDIVGEIINCAQRYQASITVSRGYGLVTNVTLLNPETHFPTPPMIGPFEMTSLLGTYVNTLNHPPCSCFSILLSGHGAVVYGGTVGGTIIAASNVWIQATLCKNLEHYQAISNNNNNHDNNVVNLSTFDDVATFPNY